MTVGIVTDSAATLPPELASGNEVAIVPMEVTINGRSNGDRRVPLQEVLRHLDDGVRTSSPSPGRFSSAIAAAEDGGGVLVLTVARSMSGTFQVASLAARRAGGPTEVLDTGTAAGGEGLVVLAAARAARAGRPLQEVLEVARRALERDEAERLLEAVRAEASPVTAFIGEFDAVMVAHTGPGLTGLAWWWEPEG